MMKVHTYGTMFLVADKRCMMKVHTSVTMTLSALRHPLLHHTMGKTETRRRLLCM